VQTMRAALLRGYGRPSTSFRLAFGALYFELTDLFLQRAAALETQTDELTYPLYPWYLHQARDTIEQFKAVELRDYFGDECLAAIPSRTMALDRVSADTVVVYPILLAERIELLASFPTGLQRFTVPIPESQVEQRVTILRNALADRDPLRYLQHAQRLYAWLIQPLEAHLMTWPVQTLVFVPDGALRLLPWAALHDGQQFLMAKYALAVTPELTLTEPQALSRESLQVLTVGLSSAVEGFPALPRVAEEVRSIQRPVSVSFCTSVTLNAFAHLR